MPAFLHEQGPAQDFFFWGGRGRRTLAESKLSLNWHLEPNLTNTSTGNLLYLFKFCFWIQIYLISIRILKFGYGSEPFYTVTVGAESLACICKNLLNYLCNRCGLRQLSNSKTLYSALNIYRYFARLSFEKKSQLYQAIPLLVTRYFICNFYFLFQNYYDAPLPVED